MLKICGNCACGRKADLQPDSATTHECRAKAPTLEPSTGVAVWPRVISSDWCGEWSETR